MRAVGENHGLHVLTESQVREIFSLAWSGWSLRQIGRKFEVSSTAVFRIKHRLVWTHVLKEEEGA